MAHLSPEKREDIRAAGEAGRRDAALKQAVQRGRIAGESVAHLLAALGCQKENST